MEDSDHIRRLIEDLLSQLQLKDAIVSERIGMNRGYLHDYFVKRSPKRMPDHVKVRLAQELKISPARLGVAGVSTTRSGFQEDAEPYVPEAGNFPTLAPHLAPFIMRSEALSSHVRRIRPGKVLVMNLNKADPAEIAIGSIVVVQLYDRNELTKGHGTIIRQFLPPDKLVTNCAGTNEILSLDDRDREYIAIIKGTLEYIIEDVRENGNREDQPRNH